MGKPGRRQVTPSPRRKEGRGRGEGGGMCRREKTSIQIKSMTPEKSPEGKIDIKR